MGLDSQLWLWLPAMEVVWVAFSGSYLVLQRRSPSSTLAWALTFAFLPVVGLIIYFFFGPRRYDKRKARRARAQKEVQEGPRGKGTEAIEDTLGPLAAQLVRFASRAVGPAGKPAQGKLKLYTSGDLLYEAIETAISKASHHIHVEYYIWEPDPIGNRLRDALVERAKAGIEVRVIVDGFGSPKVHSKYWKSLKHAGGSVCRFNEWSVTSWRPRMANFRTHRKIVVVDGEVGFTGGMNVSAVHSRAHSGGAAWRDTHVRVEGEAVRGLQCVFFEDWHYVTGIIPDLERYLVPPKEATGAGGGTIAQIVSSGPDENLDAIHKFYVAAIAGAKERVLLTTPYFVPDQALLSALSTAALAGAKVFVMVPEKGDVPFVAAAARSYYPELLEVGVRIFEYRQPMLHAKTLVVDDAVAVVGTANVDNRSFRLNFEVLVASYDASLCQELAASFNGDLAQTEEVIAGMVKNAPLFERLWVSGARLFSPIL